MIQIFLLQILCGCSSLIIGIILEVVIVQNILIRRSRLAPFLEAFAKGFLVHGTAEVVSQVIGEIEVRILFQVLVPHVNTSSFLGLATSVLTSFHLHASTAISILSWKERTSQQNKLTRFYLRFWLKYLGIHNYL